MQVPVISSDRESSVLQQLRALNVTTQRREFFDSCIQKIETSRRMVDGYIDHIDFLIYILFDPCTLIHTVNMSCESISMYVFA